MSLEWLTIVPALAFAAAVAAVVAGILRLAGNARAAAWMRTGLTTAAAAGAATMLVLIALFVLVRVDVQYVFQYTSHAVPLRYRIAGAYAGREGSLVLWAMYAAAVAAAVAWWHARNRDVRATSDKPSHVWTELVLAAVAAAFLGAVAFQDVFGSTSDFLLRNRPGGNGLNPTLLSPFILIHPPVMFLAYALTAVPLAAAVAEQITGEGAWSRIAMPWSRIDWLLYTFAMGLGGIWAYYTLGFGGYWAWDPVEVANLLPWLALTLYLHVQLHHRRHGSYRHLGPLLAVLPFVLTIFSTISTRSGLWVSVHAFTDPTGTFDPDAGSRILAILAREPGLQFHAAIFMAALLVFLALWGRRIAIDTGRLGRTSRIVSGILGAAAVASLLAPATVLGLALESGSLLTGGRVGYGLLAVTAAAILAPAAPLLISDEPTRKPRLDLRTLNLTAVVVLGIGLLVMFLWHVAATNGWSTEAYNGRFPVLAAPVMLGLIVFQAHGLWRRNALWLGAAVLMLAAAAFTVAPLWGLLTLALPLVAVSLIRVVRAARVRQVAQPLWWARIGLWAAALLNVLFWLNPPTVRLGFATWQPMWPAQLVLGGLAFLGLHLATGLLAGMRRNVGLTHVVIGLLGGFYIAPVLALASWWVHRTRDAPGVSSPGRRLHQVGLHGVHLAVAVALLGYILTTYIGVERNVVLAPDEAVDVGASARLLRVEQQTSGGWVERFLPVIEVEGRTVTQATLYWEPQSSSHYPLPATARLWGGDVYFAVDALCVDPAGVCDAPADWIRAYDVGSPLPAGIEVTQVEVQAFTLPGIGLVWSALFLWLYFMGLVMAHAPERA